MDHLFPYPKMGSSWLEILEDPLTRKLLGHDATMPEKTRFTSGVASRLEFLLQDPLKHISFAKIGYTALEAFLQGTCTGPPLDFDSEPVIIPEVYRAETEEIKKEMLISLSIDGIDAYSLIPRIELFWLARTVMNCTKMAEEGFNGRRARFRITFWHQKLLPEPSDSLKKLAYYDAQVLGQQMTSRLAYGGAAAEEHMVEFLVERANVRIFYGDDVKAREDLAWAAKIRDFEFAMTGAMGKRTKHQEKETSQLLVLAKSRDFEPEPYSSRKSSRVEGNSRKSSIAAVSQRSMSIRPTGIMSPTGLLSDLNMSPPLQATQPENLPLNDDTLLESIAFSQANEEQDPTTSIVNDDELPLRLRFMNLDEQPLLFPMDSIILLGVASSITNTHPSDGLTREEALPYATRVLEGGSSNWQVYTEALLVRSRIEGYSSRTAERGLLQLQALVDQVIFETIGTDATPIESGEVGIDSKKVSTFLSALKEGEGASVAERLRFIHQISPPFRWELEAELAARWTQMGGLRTALDIYRRLQMYTEVALCLAATDKEAEAVKLLKNLLFQNPEQEMKDGDIVQLRQPLPAEAPRLMCILGDIQEQPKYYNLAWQISSSRYARAQRSLGRFYLKKGDLEAARLAYTAALGVARLDSPTWFSLGCVQLQLQDYVNAVDSFTRVVQLEDSDAEGWSNLAVALLRLPPPTKPVAGPGGGAGMPTVPEQDENAEGAAPARRASQPDPLQHTREALRALRRAANLKREDARIWDNYLTVAASIPPDPQHPDRGTPWQEVIQAMSQIINLRGKKQGESCIDLKILEALVDHVTTTWDYRSSEDEVAPSSAVTRESTDTPPPPTAEEAEEHKPQPKRLPYTPRALLRLVDTQIAPLATANPELYNLLAQVALWRHRPAESLALVEKAWRATTTNATASSSSGHSSKPDVTGNPYETSLGWTHIVDATLCLVDAYRELGEKERERVGGPVEKGWRFKARSAVRNVMGRGKGMWEATQGWKKLEECMQELSADNSVGDGKE